jgi:glycosyltransferase involved in cell wall biosynthesis
LKQQPAILQIIPHLETGGAELSTLEIVDALSKIGVCALVATQGGRMAGDIERLGGEIIPMSAATKNPLKMFRNKQLLQTLIVERGVVLMHARSRAPAWSAMLASVKTDIPFVTTYHGAYGELEPFKKLYNSVMARGDRVIANSVFTADHIRARHGTSDNRLRVIYRGVHLEQFSASAVSNERREALRKQWDVPKGHKIILHAARLTRLKGHAIVIAAMKKLIEQGQDKDAIIVFAGDHRGRRAYVEELRQQIASAGLNKRIRLVGHCSDMAAAFALATVSILASTEPETFGRTSAEAQAMGCPVIATNIGAPPETVRAKPFVEESEITGWLVPPADPEAMATALGKVLAMNEQGFRELAIRARDNVTSNFSDELMKVRTLEVYDELLGTGFAARYVNRSSVSD